MVNSSSGSISNDILPTLYCKQAKLAGLILPRTSKLRTGTDARGSTQQRRFKAGMVPSSSKAK
ncbi:hypothetical protein HMPREF9554_01738 [Treponema phagedenis F0421]|nr:hypothetical protein HMPREF9554_01738 [Treponema phagedenis F0421]